MPRTAAALSLAVLALGALGACSDSPDAPADGTGYLQVSDLENPPQTGHFTGDPVPMTARVDVTSTGCVYVVVDDVERFPFWPAGTTVDQDPEDLDTYVVTLPGGTTLTTGESFEGSGVVDDSTEPFDEGKVTSVLDFCAIDESPVAFFDATAITPVAD